MSDTFSALRLHRPDTKPAIYNHSICARLRSQLLSELALLDASHCRMVASQARWDFSMEQTYKEMIHSRQALFRRLGK